MNQLPSSRIRRARRLVALLRVAAALVFGFGLGILFGGKDHQGTGMLVVDVSFAVLLLAEIVRVRAMGRS